MLSPGRRSFLGRTKRRLMAGASAGNGWSTCSSSASHFDGRFDGPGEDGRSVVMARLIDTLARTEREREREGQESRQQGRRMLLSFTPRGHVTEPTRHGHRSRARMR
jgi:hypothetical protein